MELPELGDHCTQPDCNVLDFLPLTCQFCSRVFCRDHCQALDHNCQDLPAAATGSDKSDFKHACSLTTCPARELVAVTCPSCSGNFCLQHRHPDDHDCSSLKDRQPSKEALAKQRIEQIAAAIPSNAKKKTGQKNSKLAEKVYLMKLKQRAVPCSGKRSPDELVFLSVLTPLTLASPRSLAVSVATSWSVGRTLDAVADLAKISNNNHLSFPTALQLYRLADCTLLPADSTLEALMRGGRVSDGEVLVLETLPRGQDVLQDPAPYSVGLKECGAGHCHSYQGQL